jgi:hypothetical protein
LWFAFRVNVRPARSAIGPLILALIVASLTHSPVLALSYYGDCDSAGGYTTGRVFPRLARTRADIGNNLFKGSYGRTTIEDIRSCTGPNTASTVGKSLVLPANLSASNDWLVQLGYGRVDCPSGYSCSLPDNARSFVYTPSDTSFGVLAPFPGAETPELNNTYSFKIESGATGYWLYTIRDLTDDQTWTTSRAQTFASGVSSFYGFEVARYWDQVGYRTDERAKVSYLQYRRSDLSAWQVLTDDPFSHCTPSSAVCDIEQSLYTFHVVYVNNESGSYDPNQSVVKAFTEPH